MWLEMFYTYVIFIFVLIQIISDSEYQTHLNRRHTGLKHLKCKSNLENAYFFGLKYYLINYDIFVSYLDEVFVISGIIKVEVSVISLSQRLRLITVTIQYSRYHKNWI